MSLAETVVGGCGGRDAWPERGPPRALRWRPVGSPLAPEARPVREGVEVDIVFPLFRCETKVFEGSSSGQDRSACRFLGGIRSPTWQALTVGDFGTGVEGSTEK